MAQIKVSALTALTSPDGAEELLINDGGTSKKITIDNVTENNFTDTLKTKLDAIEASADVTDATNVTAAGALMDSELAGIAAVKATTGTFLTADQTKLDSIEASADVTDATNVTAAGALMDSEVTNLADVKAFATSDYATAAQGTLATNALPKAGGTITGNLTVSNTEPQIHLSDTDATASGYAKIRGGASGAVFLEADPTNAESSSHITFKVDNTQMGRFTTDGLCFNSDSAAANALDDYEEGTWTPAYTGDSGVPTVAYSIQVGSYVKIGKFVFLSFSINTSSVSGGSSSSDLLVSGLPFTCGSQSGDSGALSTVRTQNWVSNARSPVGGYINANTNYIYLNSYDVGAYSSHVLCDTDDLRTTGDSNQLTATVTYITS